MVGSVATSAEASAVPANMLAADAAAVMFPMGLPGFPDQHEFTLQPIENAPNSLLMLRSVTQSTLGFVLMPIADPLSVYRADELAVGRDTLEAEVDDMQTFLVVNIHGRAEAIEAYVNLRAPVFMDVTRRVAVQLVLPNAGYSVRHKLELMRS